MKTRFSLGWIVALVIIVAAATYYVTEARDSDIEIDLPDVELNQ